MQNYRRINQAGIESRNFFHSEVRFCRYVKYILDVFANRKEKINSLIHVRDHTDREL